MKRSIIPFITAGLVFVATIFFLNQMVAPFGLQALKTKIFTCLMAATFSIATFLTLYLKEVKLEQLRSNLYIVLFFVIILSPEFVKQFNLEKKIVIDEKRTLAEKPAFTFTKDYPQKYEAYYNDNFGLRSNIISFTNKVKMSFFSSSINNELVKFGGDGFLFLASAYAIEESYTNTNLLSPEELEAVYQLMLARKTKLNEQGITFVQGYWPNKHTVYRDELPSAMKQKIKNDQSLANQVISYFAERGLTFLDVSEELLAAKKGTQLYQKFDTHWNLDGAFVAYQAFCKKTFAELGLTAFKKEDFTIKYKETRRGDLVYMLGMDEFPGYYDELPTYTTKDNRLSYVFMDASSFPERTIITVNENCKNKQVALVFRDSYGKNLIPFLSLHYHKVVYIKYSDKPYFNEEMIARVQPDVVMSLGLERYLSLVLK